MVTSRRAFLRTASLAAGIGLVGDACASARSGAAVLPAPQAGPDSYPRASDTQIRELALRAIDAAKSAGATYADVRLTLTRSQRFAYGGPPSDIETVAAGVRALVNGSWGFVATPLWTAAEMVRLGREATAQAKVNVWRGVPRVELGPPPSTATGHWTMPVKRDPFDVSIPEKLDFFRSLEAYTRTFRYASASSSFTFERQDKTFASTDGAMCSQTLYRTWENSSFTITVFDPIQQRAAARSAPFVTPVGAGYEVFDDVDIIGAIPRLYEEARRQLQPMFGENARYDIVFDGMAMAALVNETLGLPLELDRALGYEANAGGTSYLVPPDRMVRTRIASPRVTVTADRSRPGGVATARWDDDGVEPVDFALVTNGAIANYSTNRELSTLAPDRQLEHRALGCSAAADAAAMPLVRTPNLTLHADTGGGTFDELVSHVDDGLAIIGGGCMMDQQKFTGQGFADIVYRVRKGKLGPVVPNASYLIRSPEFWRSVAAIGNESTVAERGFTTWKGPPSQTVSNSVRAPAALVRDQVVIDVRTRLWSP